MDKENGYEVVVTRKTKKYLMPIETIKGSLNEVQNRVISIVKISPGWDITIKYKKLKKVI